MAPGWQLPEIGPEVVHRLVSTGVPADELCSWLCKQERLHRERYEAPLVSFCLEDAALLDDRDRGAALWERITRTRADGSLTSLRLTLDRVQPRAASPLWFALAARAGVVGISFDVGAQRINDIFQLLTDLCVSAHHHEVMPRIPLPLVGPDIAITESVTRAVVILKGALPWLPVPSPVSPELRAALRPALADTVAQGTADPVQLVELVLNGWFQHLAPVDRRALFPIWLAAYERQGEEQALAAVHPYLQHPVASWLAYQRTS